MAKRKSWKPSAKQKQQRLTRFISKYGYDPRSSYRPVRQGKRGRPQKTYGYNKALVKAANERLRKIETVYKLTEDSNEYKLAKKYATEYSKTKGKIYDVKRLNKTKGKELRFISESEFKKLSPQEQKYFNEVLSNFMQASTSTKSGIESKYQKSYETFMLHYGDKYPNLSIEDYKEFFKTYRDLVNADTSNQFDYTTLVQTLEFVDIEQALTQGQLEKAMRYVATNRFDKIPRRYRLGN